MTLKLRCSSRLYITMGGGIIPVATDGDKVYFLFGKEVEDGKWSDFGGGREKKETPFQTAVREGGEELCGFFGYGKKLATRLKKDSLGQISVNGYNAFLFKADYDPNLPSYFKHNFAFMKYKFPDKINKNGMFEKSEVEWMTISEIKRRRKQFRPFYRSVIDQIILQSNI